MQYDNIELESFLMGLMFSCSTRKGFDTADAMLLYSLVLENGTNPVSDIDWLFVQSLPKDVYNSYITFNEDKTLQLHFSDWGQTVDYLKEISSIYNP